MPYFLFSRRVLQVVAISISLFLPPPASAATWNVPGDAVTIQAGIDLASVGDTVLVAPGIWAGTGNVNLTFNGTDLTLLSSGGRDATTINCAHTNRGFLFLNGESTAAVVQGFTIRDGGATEGGGIVIDEASPLIRDCRFVSCYASSHGGAADLQDVSAPRFEDCVFDSNSTSGDYHTGGAIQLKDDGTFIHCTFFDNAAGGIGGAIRMYGAGDVTFDSCRFENNFGTDGGALAIQTVITTNFDSCSFVANHASYSGGALLLTGGLNTFTECLFDLNSSDNYTGALSVPLADAVLYNCTVTRTTSDPDWGALTVTNSGSDIDLYNTIVYGSLSGSGVKCINYGDVTPVCSNIFGNAHGDWDSWCGAGEDSLNGNFSLDPLFCDSDNGDFSLSSESPCLNAPGCGLVGAFGQGCTPPSAIDESMVMESDPFELEPAVPNPFNPSTRIFYTIPSGATEQPVRLAIHDATGRLVRELVDKYQPAHIET